MHKIQKNDKLSLYKVYLLILNQTVMLCLIFWVTSKFQMEC